MDKEEFFCIFTGKGRNVLETMGSLFFASWSGKIDKIRSEVHEENCPDIIDSLLISSPSHQPHVKPLASQFFDIERLQSYYYHVPYGPKSPNIIRKLSSLHHKLRLASHVLMPLHPTTKHVPPSHRINDLHSTRMMNDAVNHHVPYPLATKRVHCSSLRHLFKHTMQFKKSSAIEPPLEMISHQRKEMHSNVEHFRRLQGEKFKWESCVMEKFTLDGFYLKRQHFKRNPLTKLRIVMVNNFPKKDNFLLFRPCINVRANVRHLNLRFIAPFSINAYRKRPNLSSLVKFITYHPLPQCIPSGHFIEKSSAIFQMDQERKASPSSPDTTLFTSLIEDVVSIQQGIVPPLSPSPVAYMREPNYFPQKEAESVAPLTTKWIQKQDNGSPQRIRILCNMLSKENNFLHFLYTFMKRHPQFMVLFYSELFPIGFPAQVTLLQASPTNFILLLEMTELVIPTRFFSFFTADHIVDIVICFKAKNLDALFYAQYVQFIDSQISTVLASYFISFCEYEDTDPLLLSILERINHGTSEKSYWHAASGDNHTNGITDFNGCKTQICGIQNNGKGKYAHNREKTVAFQETLKGFEEDELQNVTYVMV